jgi:hypothetical protein
MHWFAHILLEPGFSSLRELRIISELLLRLFSKSIAHVSLVCSTNSSFLTFSELEYLFLEAFMTTTLINIFQLYPYHLADHICRVMRISPFKYYCDVLFEAMKNGKYIENIALYLIVFPACRHALMPSSLYDSI